MVRRSAASTVGNILAWVGGADIAVAFLLEIEVSDELFEGIVKWSLLSGGPLLMTGILVVELDRRYAQAKRLSGYEFRDASKRRLVDMAKITAGVVALNLFLWLPIIGMVKPGDGIRPMVQGPASIVISLGMLIVGLVALCEHLFFLRPRWHALVSLLLTAVAVGSYMGIECYLSAIGVSYKP